MGVSLREISVIHKVAIDEISGKKVVMDANNHLYQFLSVIRTREGEPIKDSKGRPVSHLLGLFPRTVNLMKNDVKVAYVFDGNPPKLKNEELKKRRDFKKVSKEKYEKAKEKGKIEEMKKYAKRTSKLTPEMIEESKKLLKLLGIPIVQSPSEADAQMAYIIKKGDCYTVSTQDYDPLLHGGDRLIKNISRAAKEKGPAEMILLQEILEKWGINQKELIALAMMKGTDYNPKGIKGVGFKTGLKLLRKNGVEETFEQMEPDFDWKKILELFQEMGVTEDYSLEWKVPDKEGIRKFLIDKRNFSEKRVDNKLKEIGD